MLGKAVALCTKLTMSTTYIHGHAYYDYGMLIKKIKIKIPTYILCPYV